MLVNVIFPAGLFPEVKHRLSFSRASFNVSSMTYPVVDSTLVASFKPVRTDVVDLCLPEET